MTSLLLAVLLSGVAPKGLAGVVNADKAAALPAKAREALVQNGFAVLAGEDRHFFSLYDRNAYERVPSFISADVVLHVFHVRFDDDLTRVELAKAMPALRAFSEGQLTRALAKWPDAGAPDARTKALALYHATALRLLDEDKPRPLDPRLAAEADADAKRLTAAQGTVTLASCPEPLDATRFKPRGHYDQYNLRPYFRAFTFYSLCAFPLRGESAERAKDVAKLVDEPAKAELDVLRKLLEVVAGKTDGAKRGPKAGTEGKAEVSAATTEPGVTLDEVLRGVPDAGRAQTFRLLGGAATPEAKLFERTAGTAERPFPSVLDVFSALGSPEALATLSPTPALATVLKPPLVLDDSLYGRWLKVLQLLLSRPAGLPPFAATDAWGKHTLVSAAGSWAELKHDTLLYIRQPLVMMEGGHEAELPASKVGGYVEPRADVYRELLALREALAAATAMDPKDSLSEFLHFLIDTSELELANKPFPRALDERLRTVGSELEHLSRTRGDESPPQALIADVFTLAQPDGPSQVFHVATGEVDELWVVAPRAGKQVLMRGGAYSFYEFPAKAGQRLNDEDWRELLYDAAAPARPAWATPFTRPGKPRKRD